MLADMPISQFIPYRGPMCLVDRVQHADAYDSQVEAMVRADNLFLRDGVCPAYIGMEYMAQAVAAWAGVRAWRRGLAPRAGLLLGIRSFVAHMIEWPVGTMLQIATHLEHEDATGMAVFTATMTVGGRPAAEGSVSVLNCADLTAYVRPGAP